MFSKRMEATRTMVAICSLSKKAVCRLSLDGRIGGVAEARWGIADRPSGSLAGFVCGRSRSDAVGGDLPGSRFGGVPAKFDAEDGLVPRLGRSSLAGRMVQSCVREYPHTLAGARNSAESHGAVQLS